MNNSKLVCPYNCGYKGVPYQMKRHVDSHKRNDAIV
jgi:hypothetical protein